MNNPPKTAENIRLTGRGKKLLAAFALMGVVLVGSNSFGGPEFSEKTHQELVQPGDTIWGHTSGVGGNEKVNLQAIASKIEELSPSTKDGLQPGDVLNVPNSVK